ncbi:MAG TPA: gamma-glutamyl-phosphate reductase, partial [Chitinophagales bacterium]|nr:gamma-glutamyl-phosphate reductase [Chitinophagales bacterium]
MESILSLLEAVHKAAVAVKRLTLEDKKKILIDIAEALVAQTASIIEYNKKDLDRMEDANPKKDRLLLNEDRIKALAESLHDILKLEDPTGKVLADNTMQNGLHILHDRKTGFPG